jgi:transposase
VSGIKRHIAVDGGYTGKPFAQEVRQAGKNGVQSFDKMRRNGGQMQRLPKGVYNLEFRGQAVRLYLEDNLTAAEISSRLSIPKGRLKNGVAAARRGKLGEVGKSQEPLGDLELGLAKLKRELAEVKMGRGLLKKCTTTFVGTSA